MSNADRNKTANHTTRILILGAGVMQLPALRWARQQGWEIFAADGNPAAPGVGLADHFVPVDLTDIEGMIAAAGDIHRTKGLHGVFTAGTDFSYTVARVAEALQLPGLPPAVALNASRKDKMRQIFAEHGVASPKYVRLTPEDSPEKALEQLSLPLVVKPVDNMGARGIRRVDTPDEYRCAVGAARRFSRAGIVIVEEYIEGPEFSIDALVVEDEIVFTGIADRHIFFPPYFIEMGHTIPTSYDGAVLDAVKSVFSQAVRALKIRNGAAKGDVKWDGRRAVIGEVAARLSGGYMSGWTFPYCSGVELTGNALRQAVGCPPESLSPAKQWVSAERAFISIPGVVKQVEQAAEARSIAWIKEMFVRVAAGNETGFPTNNVEKSGNFISAAPNRESAVTAAEEACRTVFVRLEANTARTRGFLFGEKEAWIPDAFTLTRQKNRQVLQTMPDFEDRRSEGNTSIEIAVRGLPELDLENACDWHGTPIHEAWKKVLALGNATVANEENSADIVIGKAFWNAFLRGGMQGAVWLIDSVRKTASSSEALESVITEPRTNAADECE